MKIIGRLISIQIYQLAEKVYLACEQSCVTSVALAHAAGEERLRRYETQHLTHFEVSYPSTLWLHD